MQLSRDQVQFESDEMMVLFPLLTASYVVVLLSVSHARGRRMKDEVTFIEYVGGDYICLMRKGSTGYSGMRFYYFRPGVRGGEDRFASDLLEGDKLAIMDVLGGRIN